MEIEKIVKEGEIAVGIEHDEDTNTKNQLNQFNVAELDSLSCMEQGLKMFQNSCRISCGANFSWIKKCKWWMILYRLRISSLSFQNTRLILCLLVSFGVCYILPVFEEVQTVYSSFQFSLAWFWPSTKLVVKFSMTRDNNVERKWRIYMCIYTLLISLFISNVDINSIFIYMFNMSD